MDNEKNNFLDKNTVLAIGLSILFFIGWQKYIQKRYPEYNKKKTSFQQTTTETNTLQKQKPQPKNKQDKEFLENNTETEKHWNVSTALFNFQISSYGMGITRFELNQYTDRENKKIDFVTDKKGYGNFSTLFKNKPIIFSVKKTSETHFTGLAEKEGYRFKKEMVFNTKNYSVDIILKVFPPKESENNSVETVLSGKAKDKKTSFLTPSYEGTEFFTLTQGDEERDQIDLAKGLKKTYEQSTLSSIGTLYFTTALKDQSNLIPNTSIYYDPTDKRVLAKVSHQIKNGNVNKFHSIGFVGPKKYDLLKEFGGGFVKVINYGVFSVLSKPILTLLKFLYKMTNNWGLAIIILTVFIRLLLLPINVSSMRSMKKVQKIQPQLTAIKEKYKGDNQRINQETMALMKKEKANPLGGCLPMFLQIPVFFALYSVLSQSIELYKSPFIFWIKDLSYKDPFFVLPVSVSGLYFLQMSLSPQPMDPTQAKLMKMMPILFCFFMITVPSGLTLYFLVNTIFGIGQQFVFQREKRKPI